MKRAFLPILLLELALTLTGCSLIKGPMPPNIYQDYSINASKLLNSVVVQFRRDGPDGEIIELRDGADVEHNGEFLTRERRVYSDTFAYKIYPQQFVGENNLVFTMPDGRRFKSRLTIEPVEWASEPINLDRTHDLRLKLSRPVTETEKLIFGMSVLIPDEGQKDTAKTSISLQNNFGDDRSVIVIKAADLAELKSGRAVATVEVNGEKPTDEGLPAGGRITYNYRSDHLNISVPK